VVLEQVFKQLITVPSYRDNLLCAVRRGGRKRWDHARREGGDVTSSEVKSNEQEKEYYTTVIK